ncbi:flagellar protein FlaG [Paenibacillus gorillae]|uniref:flagellar protein FlaG n=1 Tax=Paenibacillus gorillae TaxID=1243662 RepID=UPI0005A62645|nr:flagellar protein FlaG [Paenibacillus gorillae]
MNISSINTTGGNLADKNLSSGPVKETVVNNTINVENVPMKGIISTTDESEKVKKTIDRIMQSIQGPNTTVERSVHEATNHILYKVKDKETGEVIREIPEEKLLDLVAKQLELNGILIDEKV